MPIDWNQRQQEDEPKPSPNQPMGVACASHRHHRTSEASNRSARTANPKIRRGRLNEQSKVPDGVDVAHCAECQWEKATVVL